MYQFWKKRKTSNADFFFKRFSIISIQLFAVISVLIIVLAYFEILSEREKSTSEIKKQIGEKASFLSYKIENLKKQVSILQNEAQSYYQTFYAYPRFEDNVLKFVAAYSVQDSLGYSFDILPDSLYSHMGNITGTGVLAKRLKDDRFREELALQLNIGSLFAGIKNQFSEVTWVYTISKNDYAHIYPFPLSYAARYDPAYLEYDIFSMGLPENNKDREVYITPVYLDAGGKGMMVSIGAPVYDNTDFRAIVGLDVTLHFLNEFLKTSSVGGEFFIVNERDQLLAHRTLIHETDTTVRSLQEALEGTILSNLDNQHFVESDDKTIFVEALKSVPWKIIFITKKKQLSLSDIFGEYYIVLITLFGLIIFLILFTYLHYIKPAQQLVLFIEGHAINKIVKHGRIHPSWKEWFGIVSRVFERKQEVIYSLDAQVREKHKELVMANKELLRQKEQLIKEHEAKDKIFSIVSHDLKAPIASLVGIMGLLHNGNISGHELKHLLPDVETRTKKIKLMLENLLQWSVCNLRAENIKIKQVNLTDSIRDNIQLLESIAATKNIKLVFNTKEAWYVQTDRNVLDLVLRNLIYNGIKFSFPNSDVVVTLDAEEHSTIVHIKDGGQGIPELLKDKIFRFGENCRDGTSHEKGTGLGLALCKEFLAKVGGTIYFKSEEQVGSVFSFSMPVSKPFRMKTNSREVLETT